MEDIFEGQLNLMNTVDEDNILWNGNVWNKGVYGNLICKNLTIKVITNAQNKPVYYIGIYSNPDAAYMPFNGERFDDEDAFLISKQEIEIISGRIEEQYGDQKRFAIMSLQFLGGLRKLFEANQRMHGKFLTIANNGLKEDAELSILAIPRTDIIILAIDDSHNVEGNLTPTEETGIKDIVKRLEYVLKRIQITLGLEQLEIKFNIGVAIFEKHGSTTNEVLKNSLVALEVLTKFKKENMLIYNEAYYDYIREDLIIREGLRTAFEKNELKLVYQPQFSLKDDQLYGFEALVRWHNDQLGNVTPDRFIPILEETEDIYRLGMYVIDRALEEFKSLQNNISGLRLSINLSSKEFANNAVLEYLFRQKTHFDDLGVKLCIEITETTLVENMEHIKDRIQWLQNKGFEVAIDDFGTGYSSLGYLKEMYADELKIDRMFIRDFPERDDGKLIRAVISMGKEMKLSLVVEGIETVEQYEWIRNSGCDLYQGYYGAKPLSLSDIEALINQSMH
ncbi:MAG: hypothetical protein PWP51_2076 [Clostridiales bacterium]|jgi:EAL domain-containing protein (putative c-di-GMP-specific phosphodiesterase class I)|nr:hypothetical protein [Clostridiales bacterium]